jgi:hypothetical protein
MLALQWTPDFASAVVAPKLSVLMHALQRPLQHAKIGVAPEQGRLMRVWNWRLSSWVWVVYGAGRGPADAGFGTGA